MRDLQSDIALSDQLNQRRLALAQQQLGAERVPLFWQLPWLLALNHPELPGFVDGAPSGFARPPLTPCPEPWLALPQGDPILLGLYTMGSTGTFGQGPESDLDCWVVHPSTLTAAQQQALQRKCEALSRHFTEQGLELHLYLVTPQMLEQGQSGALSAEHSGSAQNWLLLEEFYRTQIRLAGQPLAWWPGAPQDHPELLSLGQLSHLPAAEFFGAALWQLFKGLDQPHKAALKVLLLEAYVADYPDQRILRDQLWYRLRAGQGMDSLDPYLMLYQRVSDYLKRESDRRRLTMAQRCFYLKCALPLSQPASAQDWRYPTLKALTEQWRWTAELLDNLDHAKHWHAGQLRWCNERLDHVMLTSYQRLTGFAARQRLRSRLKLEDLGVLTRKLYTRFEAEPAKIPQLNPLWSDLLTEEALTLVAVRDNPHHPRGWYLYRRPPKQNQLFGESPLYNADSRLACLAWALTNGLVGPTTEIHCHQGGQSWHSQKLTRLCRRLHSAIPPRSNPSLTALQAPWRYTRVVLLCNVEQDPTAQWHGQSLMMDLQGAPVFATGRPKRNLVGSLTLLTENSWGERHCFRFEEEEGLLKLLAQLLSGLDRRQGPLPIQVFSASKKLTTQLEDGLAQLLERVQRLFCQATMERTQVWPLALGHRQYGLFIDPRGLRWQRLDKAEALLGQLKRKGVVELPKPDLGEDPYAGAPAILGQYARRGLVQVFVRERPTGLDIYLLDERNELKQLTSGAQGLSGLVEELSHLYAFQRGNASLGASGTFNLPQFYRLSRSEGGELAVEPLAL
ncbi:adenylate cyclase [Ferrimonas balearica]|uniref:adenylate cyclase n=1 Tax=Ferrimonas balearica TaxID=44012 RepID=UPI001C99C3D4|nr:adenylate cyclase [Ferrimonas balearica]MBY5993338.1 class I adenylate cyclase [Ferrimonas balearica]